MGQKGGRDRSWSYHSSEFIFMPLESPPGNYKTLQAQWELQSALVGKAYSGGLVRLSMITQQVPLHASLPAELLADLDEGDGYWSGRSVQTGNS